MTIQHLIHRLLEERYKTNEYFVKISDEVFKVNIDGKCGVFLLGKIKMRSRVDINVSGNGMCIKKFNEGMGDNHYFVNWKRVKYSTFNYNLHQEANKIKEKATCTDL